VEIRTGHGRMAYGPHGQDEGAIGTVRDADAGVCAHLRVIVHPPKKKIWRRAG